MSRLRYLKVGLALVLMFVAVKMLITEIYKIPIGVSLGVVMALLAGATIVSLLAPAHSRERARGRAGRPASIAPA